MKPKIDSLSLNLPFLNVSFSIKDDIEKEIISELLIRSEDKRFLTSLLWRAGSTEV